MPRKWGLFFLIACIGYSLSGQEKKEASGGATIFKEKCGLCHGADGSGDTPLGKQLKAADLRTKTVRQMSDSKLRRLVHDGRGDMPPYSEQLSNDGIDQVVKYVRTLGKIRKR